MNEPQESGVHSGCLLNPHQARWSLFFSRFDFFLSYCPDSENIKPDACLHGTLKEECPRTVLRPSCLVAMAVMDIMRTVEEALVTQPGPKNTLPDQLYVPEAVQSSGLTWTHVSPFACHPQESCALAPLSHKFWWPTARRDPAEFVAAYVQCAWSKASSTHPSGLPHPLAIPWHPWSHIALGFVTSLAI